MVRLKIAFIMVHVLIRLHRKVMIILEELGLDYDPIYINIMTGDQKKESHTKYNPNGRIPTLVDHKNNDFAVWFVRLLFLRVVSRSLTVNTGSPVRLSSISSRSTIVNARSRLTSLRRRFSSPSGSFTRSLVRGAPPPRLNSSFFF